MAAKIGIAENSITINGFPFDPRGVAEVERTRDLRSWKRPADPKAAQSVAKHGRDMDGAYRAFARLDGKA